MMDKNQWQAGALGAFFGALCGIGAMVALSSMSADQQGVEAGSAALAQGPPDGSFDEVAASLDALRAAVVDLRGALGAVTPSNGVERVPLGRDGAPSVRDEELALAIRELTRAVKSTGRLPGSPGGSSAELDTSTWVDRVAAHEALRVSLDPDVDDDAYWNAIKAIKKDHSLWSAQQVLDVYGKPDRVSVLQNGMLSWRYEFPRPDGERDDLIINLYEGLVVDIDADIW